MAKVAEEHGAGQWPVQCGRKAKPGVLQRERRYGKAQMKQDACVRACGINGMWIHMCFPMAPSSFRKRKPFLNDFLSHLVAYPVVMPTFRGAAQFCRHCGAVSKNNVSLIGENGDFASFPWAMTGNRQG